MAEAETGLTLDDLDFGAPDTEIAPIDQSGGLGLKDLDFTDTSIYDQVQRANRSSISSDELREGWEAQGKIGWAEYATRFQKDLELVPFASIGALYEPGQILFKANKLKDNDYAPNEAKQREADYQEVKAYAMNIEELQTRGLDYGGMFWAAGSETSAFFLEFIASAGVYPIVKKGAKEAAGQTIKRSLKEAVKGYAKQGAKALAKEAKRTAVFMGHRVGLNYQDRLLNDQLSITNKGDLIMRDATEAPATTFYKAFTDIWIENISEVIGGKLIDEAAGAIGRRLPKKMVEDFVKAIPDGKFKKLLETGWETLTFKEKKLAFSGVLTEFGEERLGDLLRVATGVDDRDISLFDKSVDALFPDSQQVLVELGLFGVFGAVSFSGQKLIKRWEQKGMSDNEIENRLQVMSETEKDFEVDKLDFLEKEAAEARLPKIDEKTSIFHKFYTQAVNRNYPIEQLSKAAKKQGVELDKDTDPLLLSRQYLGIGPVIKDTLENNTFLINEEGQIVETGEGLKPIFNAIDETLMEVEANAETRRDDFQDYLVARRNLEDLVPREDVTVSDKEVAKAVGDLLRVTEKYGEVTIKKMDEISQRLYNFQARVLENEVHAGQRSKESYDDILANNKRYIPFERIKPDEADGAKGQRRGKFTRAKSTVKKIKGSDLAVENVYESVVMNTVDIMKRAQENKVAKAVAKLADVFPDSIRTYEVVDTNKVEKIQEKIDKVNEKIETEHDSDKLDKLNDQLNKLEVEIETAMEPQLPKNFKPTGNVIEYYEDGKRKFVEVSPALKEAMDGLSEPELQWYIKILAVPARMLRTGATITPDFMVSNFLRDQHTAAIQTNIGFRPFIDPIMSLADIFGKKGHYKTWIRSGAAYSGLIDSSRDSVKKSISELLNQKTLLSKLNIVTTLSDISQIFESATRVGMVRAAKRAGYSDAEAGLAAREGTLDFGVRGSKTRDLNALTAFMNAGIQSFDKTVRTFRDNPVSTTFKSIAYITVPTVLLYMKNRDDEEYWELPQWRRDIFWNVKIDIPEGMIDSARSIGLEITTQKDGATAWLSYPKPFGLGQIFGTLPERFLQDVDKSDPHAFDDIVGNMADALLPATSAADLFPTAIVPIIEGTANYNFFTGRDMVPDYKLDREPFLQYNKGTSETAKEIGKALNISPAIIDNTIQGYLGSSGRYTLEASDAMVNSIKRAAGEKVKERPREISDVPFLRRFVRSRPFGYQSESVQRFFDLSSDLKEIHNTANALKNMRSDRYEDYRNEHSYELRMYKRFNKIRSRISKFGNAIDRVVESDDTKENKLQYIRENEKSMTEVAKNALTEYKGGNK